MSILQAPTVRIWLAATVGNTLEWFDFAVYGYFARDIGHAFFPKADPGVQLIEAFGVFAVGYLMRPIGSLVLGPIGDLAGRKAMLLTSVVVMAAASLAIGLLPTYAEWGPLAAFCLLGCRMAQGFSVGGEYTGSITYVVETAPVQRRGLASSMTGAGTLFGFVLGALASTLINQNLAPQDVASWGWRIPFFIGAIAGLFALWLREGIPDSLQESPKLKAREHLVATLRHWRPMVKVMAIIAMANVSFYLLFVFLVQYAIGQQPQNAALYSGLTTLSEALGIPIIVLGGWLSDRWGSATTMRWWNLTLAVVAIPAVVLMQQATPLGVMAGQGLALLPLMLILGTYPSLLPSLFDEGSRCTGFSISYSLTVALLGGTVPLVAAWMLGEVGWSWGPGLYCALWAIPSLWALKGLKNP
uniref:MFS transporter n=1 Tax=Cyanobium sp. TaxID=2164130 RepID=UPI004047356F